MRQRNTSVRHALGALAVAALTLMLGGRRSLRTAPARSRPARRSIPGRPASWRRAHGSAAPAWTPARCGAGASPPTASSAMATRMTSATTRRRARSADRSGSRTNGARNRRGLLSRLRDPRHRPGALLGLRERWSAWLRQHKLGRRARLGGAGRPRRWTNGGRDHGRRPSHLRDPRQRQGALLGPGVERTARLRRHAEDRRQRDARLGGTGRPRRGTNGGGHHRRRVPHLRDPRQRHGALLG